MTPLEAKVAGQNRVNQVANEIHKILTDHFRPMIGQKIRKADGELMKKVKDNLPNLEYDDCQLWCNNSIYSFYWTVKICIMANDRAYYSEASVYIGDIDRDTQVLTGVYDKTQQDRKTDFSAKEIEQTRNALREAKERVRQLQSQLSPFDEYDR